MASVYLNEVKPSFACSVVPQLKYPPPESLAVKQLTIIDTFVGEPKRTFPEKVLFELKLVPQAVGIALQ